MRPPSEPYGLPSKGTLVSLNYRLPPDSVLFHPDAPERVFGDPGQYLFCQRMQDLQELGFDTKTIFHKGYAADALKPCYSVLTQEEIDELLTPAGTVWFLCEQIGLDLWETSRLYEAGIPWPLRPQDDDLHWARKVLKQEQFDYLSCLFQPIGRHSQILIELENKGWEAPDQPDGGPVKQVRAYWQHLARETGEDIRMVRWAALVLYRYYQCIQNFEKQQRVEAYRLGERSTD